MARDLALERDHALLPVYPGCDQGGPVTQIAICTQRVSVLRLTQKDAGCILLPQI